MAINGVPAGGLTGPSARPVANAGLPPTGQLPPSPANANDPRLVQLFTLLSNLDAAMRGGVQAQNAQVVPAPQQPSGFVPPGLANKPGHLPPGIYKKLYGGQQPVPPGNPGTPAGPTASPNPMQNPLMLLMTMMEMLLSRAQPATAAPPLPPPSGNNTLPGLAPGGNTMQPQGLNTVRGTLEVFGFTPP
jgi:hypothetical protein